MKHKHLIKRLLSGKNELTRGEKDQILRNVLAGQKPTFARRRRRFVIGVVGIAAVCAAVLVLFFHQANRDDRPRLVAKGDGQAEAGLEWELFCDVEASCVRGQKLHFSISSTAEWRYFAAFAQTPRGEVVWYVPTQANGTSVDLQTHLVHGVFDRRIVIEQTQAIGWYTVYGVFSKRPLTRTQIKARFAPGRPDVGPGTVVLVRKVEVK